MFVKCHEMGLVNYESVDMWKEDMKNKTKGKMKALIEVKGRRNFKKKKWEGVRDSLAIARHFKKGRNDFFFSLS